MKIIDFHSHFFARPFFEALAAQSPLPGDPEEKLAVIRRTGIELPPADVKAHLARWVDDLDTKGVAHLVTFASLPEEIPAVAEATRLADGRITPVALVNPRAPDSGTRVEGLMDVQGFAGVLVFPALHHFHIAGQESRAMLQALDARRGIIYVHCGLLVVKLRDLLGLPRVYDLSFANPLGVIPAANAFPNCKFVIPHFGAGFLRETLLAGAQCENVFVDTSSSNNWVKTQVPKIGLKDVFARALDVFGASRILFGTDSNVFPAGWRRDRLEDQKATLDGLGLPEAEQERIFAGNALRLLRRE
ncbi:MAG: amidohydrolase family protein [Planctomycetota bacterium]|nr:amidohydrolase family protein [Planctomycetota bacterium]